MRKRKTLEALVEAYHHEFPELLDDPNQVAAELKRLSYTSEQAALMMLAYADGLLPRIFEFSFLPELKNVHVSLPPRTVAQGPERLLDVANGRSHNCLRYVFSLSRFRPNGR